MRTLTKTGLGALLGGLIAVPALAGGLSAPVAEPPVMAPVAPVMQGMDWTGGYVGANLGYGRGAAGAASDNGTIYGLRGGYDWDLGNWVVGAGVDWDKTDINFAGSDKIDSIGRLKLKAGADLGKAQIYATGGAARAEATIGGTGHSDNGWFAGVGAEYALSNQWTVGGEVLTNRFDNFANTGTDVDATTASVNVGFRF